MAAIAGSFVWYEWMGDDVKAAADFYGHVVGWKAPRTPTWPAGGPTRSSAPAAMASAA